MNLLFPFAPVFKWHLSNDLLGFCNEFLFLRDQLNTCEFIGWILQEWHFEIERARFILGLLNFTLQLFTTFRNNASNMIYMEKNDRLIDWQIRQWQISLYSRRSIKFRIYCVLVLGLFLGTPSPEYPKSK